MIDYALRFIKEKNLTSFFKFKEFELKFLDSFQEYYI